MSRSANVSTFLTHLGTSKEVRANNQPKMISPAYVAYK